MTQTQHTPGPWQWGFYGPDDEWVRDSKGDAIVRVGHNQSEREGNARLIAEAPAMRHAVVVLRDLAIVLLEKEQLNHVLFSDLQQAYEEATNLLARIDGTEGGA